MTNDEKRKKQKEIGTIKTKSPSRNREKRVKTKRVVSK